jgi:hypothetical protein
VHITIYHYILATVSLKVRAQITKLQGDVPKALKHGVSAALLFRDLHVTLPCEGVFSAMKLTINEYEAPTRERVPVGLRLTSVVAVAQKENGKLQSGSCCTIPIPIPMRSG